ncbi:MAG: methyltransferase [Sphingobacteriales bacterium]|nr:methyltransferase [Sphingobacteriales bacterium]
MWDCGCGFGTTAFFLAMNGMASYGSTLEYYYPFIEQRRKYWDQFGNSNLFTAGYEDIYQNHPVTNSTDIIIVQDTLRHLEPIDKALDILYEVLKPGGMLLVIEENGGNIIQRLKLFKQRGNKRIIKLYDDVLKREIVMGNENIRTYKEWEMLFQNASLVADKNSLQYIRYYLPFNYNDKNAEQLATKEQEIKNSFLQKYFFFGINFLAFKNK